MSAASAAAAAAASAASAASAARAGYVIIGGGIAGMVCAQQLATLLSEEDEAMEGGAAITVLSASPQVKLVTDAVRLTRNLELFKIRQETIPDFNASAAAHTSSPATQLHARVRVVQAQVQHVDVQAHVVHTTDGRAFAYSKLAVCSGGRSALIADSPYVVGVRDTESIEELAARLGAARRVLMVGNGGIALELSYQLRRRFDFVWAVKETYLGNTFLDQAASAFVMPLLFPEVDPEHTMPKEEQEEREDMEEEVEQAAPSSRHAGPPAMKKQRVAQSGSSLGPLWLQHLDETLRRQRGGADSDAGQHSARIEFGCHVQECVENGVGSEFPLTVRLSNGNTHQVDFVISATGVVPNTEYLGDEFARAADGGIVVNDQMQTSCEDVFAAGDCCTVDVDTGGAHWFQMRLWSQAKVLAHYCALAMAGRVDSLGFDFELFAHVTTFFGKKVAVLGRYNGQGLGEVDKDYRVMIRCKPGEEFIKLVLKDDRLVGATLIGETDLEETFENLILDAIDLSPYGDDLLDPDIDLEDYFD